LRSGAMENRISMSGTRLMQTATFNWDSRVRMTSPTQKLASRETV
jgi:hypothetical protein